MRRLWGVLALLTGAALAVAGTWGMLYGDTPEGGSSGFRVTSWYSEYATADGAFEVAPDSIRFGVPVVVAAAVLVVAAVLVLATTRLPRWTAVTARVGAVAGAALLTGSVWATGQLVLVMTRDDDTLLGIFGPSVGGGTWTLVAACVVALAGALLVQRSPEPVYQLPFDDDTDTPPMGVPIHPSVSTEESSPG